jgi:RNA polymerase sigma-70 factor, ECF subfamily
VLTLVAPDRHLAEDVVQETMLRAWRHGRVLQQQTTLLPWLFTVARRIVIDEHRKRAVRPPEVDGAILNMVGDGDKVDGMLTRVVLLDALASLSVIHREALHEVYFRHSDSQQAARALGTTPGTVRSRCYYALRALALALAERGKTRPA